MRNETLIAEPTNLKLYVQKMLRPINSRFYFAAYVNSLPIMPSDNIVEFGSGIGTVAKMIAQKLTNGQLTCVDISDRYLNVARKHLREYSNTSFLQGRLNNLNLKKGKYDAINVHDVLHDVSKENRSMLINEMFSLLRPGGKVFLREPMKTSHGIPPKEIRRLFSDAGFIAISEEKGKNRMYGSYYSACYAKISTIQFFFS